MSRAKGATTAIAESLPPVSAAVSHDLELLPDSPSLLEVLKPVLT
jgi:hypothetical protein